MRRLLHYEVSAAPRAWIEVRTKNHRRHPPISAFPATQATCGRTVHGSLNGCGPRWVASVAVSTAVIPERFTPVLAELAPLAQRFAAAGHRLYLVGGAVRDLLLGEPVDDSSIST